MGRSKNPNPKRKAPEESDEVNSLQANRELEFCSTETHGCAQPSNPDLAQKKKQRVIQEDDDEEDMIEEYPQEDQEVSVTEDNHGRSIVQIIQSNPLQEQPEKIRLLKRYSMPETFSTIVLNEQHEPIESTEAVNIFTTEGACILLKHAAGDAVDWFRVGLAVADGTLQLVYLIGKKETTIHINITQKAMTACSPQNFPMTTTRRKKPSKRFLEADNLHHALALLYPHTVASDVIRMESSGSISAKMIYNIVDNVQLQNNEQRGVVNRERLSIDGLVPTLRPYQEAAVRWMLKREEGNCVQKEWELAWYALGADLAKLCEWKTRLKDHDRPVLYCPFSGWLVKSYDDARTASISSNPFSVKGGILAESMGLGKTVEAIACILANQKKTQSNATTLDRERNSSLGRSETFENTTENSEPSTPSLMSPSSAPAEKRPRVEPQEDGTLFEGICFCGKENNFKGSLGLVVCRSCKEIMHGVCAGFRDAAQLASETSAIPGHNNTGRDAIRECSEERCPSCNFSKHSAGSLLESRATLIITPSSILDQWQREIRRHTAIQQQTDQSSTSPAQSTTRPLKVVVYPGIRKLLHGKPNVSADALPACHLVHPQVLADTDVVLMTFEALLGDLCHSDENPFIEEVGSRLRARKRYRVVPSPLSSIKWWRVCLDEAQRVETPTATSAKMALKLECHHRWCISGTPIGRGKLEDLYGLLLFLRLQPFATKNWFRGCFHSGHGGVMDRVKELLSHVFWRSTKRSESVRTQMGVPGQEEKKIFLTFSSIEKHFYRQQVERTMLSASEVIGKSKAIKRRRKSTKSEQLSQEIHRLRAACCHPQVGSSGLGKPLKKRRAVGDVSVSSGVLTMDQILDRLIDDAKLKCEEAQRLTIMHTNAMAAAARLKVEARGKGVDFRESDAELLGESCKLYMDSLDLSESNGKPTTVTGEAVLSGCRGFQSPRMVIRDGKALVHWVIRDDGNSNVESLREVWSRFDFEGPSKKICELKVRPVVKVPEDFSEDFQILMPKDCVFQVSHASLGGEFVDVVEFTLDKEPAIVDDAWVCFGGFRTNKSKGWRLVIKNFHCDPAKPRRPQQDLSKFYIGAEVQLLESEIASDSLQRLHVLHNVCLSLSSLEQLRSANCASLVRDKLRLEVDDINGRVETMQQECRKIEGLYMDGAHALHAGIQRDLGCARNLRKEAERAFRQVSNRGQTSKSNFWDDRWWDDMLVMWLLYGRIEERAAICDRVQMNLDGFVESMAGNEFKTRNPRDERYKGFPRFNDVDRLEAALLVRLSNWDGSKGYKTCMEKFAKLSPRPTEAEIIENSQCGVCHADWNQVGPTCRHCKLEKELLKLDHDPLIMQTLYTLWKWLGDNKSTGQLEIARKEARVDERAERFFDLIKTVEKELQQAKKAWRIHSDLLNDIDEINQCKRSVRLVRDDEDLSRLTEDELNAVVIPIDINAKYMDHAAKQAMALANLRRHSHTLRYLRNQSREREEEAQNKSQNPEQTEAPSCILCLSSLEGERAVLACGHAFHTSCLERLSRKSHSSITCPLRCSLRTKKEDVMIATEKRKDDGSKGNREVKGSFGTKVTRLVGDLMDVADLDEKALVYSQWEDMLEVVEQALVENDVGYVRVKSLGKIGESIMRFRSNDCSVLLLNVKNGAEGLTLVEATHVFMVEPLLNCGLDNQAINRIHRIGQTSKTYVHRYLIQDTIEVKIDKIRMEQDDELEDSINETRKKHAIGAGGIDGGFTESELQEILR